MDQNVPVVPELPQENTEVDIPLRHIGWMAGLVIVPLILITFVIPFLKPSPTKVVNSQPAIAPTPVPSLFATVISAKGTTNVARNNQAFPAVVNLAVLAKDTIETGPQSNLGLLFDDGSILRLEENSKVQVSEYSHQNDAWIIVLDQLWGRTWNRVQKLTASSVYEVRTPTAIASVRGTVFGVDATNTNSVINVSEGTVVAKILNKQSVVIQPNSTAPTPIPVKTIKEVIITAQQQIDIKKTDVEIVRHQVENKLPPTVAIVARPIETAQTPEWVTRNTEEDKKYAPIFEKIRQEREKQTTEKKENKDNSREFIREIVKEIVPTQMPFSPPAENMPNPPAGCRWQTVQCVTTPCNPIMVCDTPATIVAPSMTPTTMATPTQTSSVGTNLNNILVNPTYAAYYQSKITPKIEHTSVPTVMQTPVPTRTPSSTTDTNQ